MLIVILSDASDMLEIVHAENLERHILLRHTIGWTQILGGFDGPPSNRQIGEILAGRMPEAVRIRSQVAIGPTGATAIHLGAPAEPAGAKPDA